MAVPLTALDFNRMLGNEFHFRAQHQKEPLMNKPNIAAVVAAKQPERRCVCAGSIRPAGRKHIEQRTRFEADGAIINTRTIRDRDGGIAYEDHPQFIGRGIRLPVDRGPIGVVEALDGSFEAIDSRSDEPALRG